MQKELRAVKRAVRGGNKDLAFKKLFFKTK